MILLSFSMTQYPGAILRTAQDLRTCPNHFFGVSLITSASVIIATRSTNGSRAWGVSLFWMLSKNLKASSPSILIDVDAPLIRSGSCGDCQAF